MAKKKRDRSWPPLPPPLPLPVVDNHTHLDFEPDLPEDVSPLTLAEHVERAAAVGIDRIVQCGCDLPDARWTVEVVNNYPAMLGAIAIHPNESTLHATPEYPTGAHDIGPDGLTMRRREHHEIPLVEAISEIGKLAKANPRIRAIGETGLDYFRTGPHGAAIQREAFRAHIALAKELDLALQIHDRDAHADVIDLLLADGAPERTVFHCYSGDAEMAQVCADNGWYLSFAGPITYPANEVLREALRITPLELLLVETDAPFLTPHPYRGRPNAPYVMGFTVWAMAEIRLQQIDELCAALADNAERVYGYF